MSSARISSHPNSWSCKPRNPLSLIWESILMGFGPMARYFMGFSLMRLIALDRAILHPTCIYTTHCMSSVHVPPLVNYLTFFLGYCLTCSNHNHSLPYHIYIS